MMEEDVDRLFAAQGLGFDQLDEDLGSESSLVSDWQRVATLWFPCLPREAVADALWQRPMARGTWFLTMRQCFAFRAGLLACDRARAIRFGRKAWHELLSPECCSEPYRGDTGRSRQQEITDRCAKQLEFWAASN